MKVREMPQYWCELCWAALIWTGFPLVGMITMALFLLFSGVWVPFMWVLGASVLYGGVIFTVAYMEARTHWKRKALVE